MMIDCDNLRIITIKGLKKYLKCQVIRNSQNAEPPPFPYITYKITTYATQNKGTYGEYEDGKARKPVKQIWSITAHSDNYSDAITLANKARDWLDYVGTVYLYDNDVTVESVGAVTDRSNVLTVDYQYSYGFDCTFSVFDEIDIPDNGTIERVVYEETLIPRLKDRLDGVDKGDLAVSYDGNAEDDSELIETLERRLEGME